MSWQKRIIVENRNALIKASVVSLIFTTLYIMFPFQQNHIFVWETIEPIEQPSIVNWILYSALTYVSIGALLYFSGFYLKLHDLVVKSFGAWRTYKAIKRSLWKVLILITFGLVAGAIKLLNYILSLAHNLISLILYIFPILGIFLLSSIIFCLIFIFISKQINSINVRN